jgi:hypothetical protein
MGTPPQQYVYIHLAGSDEQRIRIAWRDYCVAMSEPNPKTSMSYNFRKG